MKQQIDNPTAAASGDTTRFRQMVEWWTEHLGRHQVPLHDRAEDINCLLGSDAVHHDLIKEVVRKVYCANRCSHLDAGVSLEDTFTVLGQMQETLLSSPHADVDQMNLLDSIGWHTRQYFELSSGRPHLTASEYDFVEAESDAPPLDNLRAN